MYNYILLFVGFILGVFGGVLVYYLLRKGDDESDDKIVRIAKEMKEDFLLAGIEEKDHVLAVYYMMELIRDTKEQLNDFKQYIHKDLKCYLGKNKDED